MQKFNKLKLFVYIGLLQFGFVSNLFADTTWHIVVWNYTNKAWKITRPGPENCNKYEGAYDIPAWSGSSPAVAGMSITAKSSSPVICAFQNSYMRLKFTDQTKPDNSTQIKFTKNIGEDADMRVDGSNPDNFKIGSMNTHPVSITINKH